MSRAWQAGDLVQQFGEWRLLTTRDAKRLNEPHTINIAADGLTLLAAADAPLWEALRGLPRAHEDMAGALWIALGGAPGTGCSGMHLRKGLPPVFRPANRSFADDLPELKQAIQRFEALQQFIAQHREVRNGNV